MKTLIKNVNALLPDGTTPQTNICIDCDKIVAIGEVPEHFHPSHVIDGTDHLAIPGLVNAHTHASMTLFRSYADDMMLQEWLEDKLWPREALMTKGDIYWGAMLAMVEFIKTGTTSFLDMYGPYMELVAEATMDAGLRGVLSRGMIGLAPDADAKLEENIELYKNFHGADNGRITVMFAPHAPYTCPPDYLRKVAETAKSFGAGIHIHMHETQREVDDYIKQYGKRSFKAVEETGIFDNPTVAAHCVHLDEEDIAIIKKHHISVAHNPGSNLKLASGIAPVPRLLAEGVNVALGTDGAASNNNLDMLEEVNLAAMIHTGNTNDPLAVPALTAMKMGTENGAKALGLKNVGRLEKGWKADITLLNMQGPAWCPRHNLLSLAVYSAHSESVDTVLVDGRVLMEKGELRTLDEERIYAEARRCAKRLCY